MNCDQILVRCYHILSCFQCRKDVCACRLNTADQLDHDINRRIPCDIIPVRCKNRRIFYFLNCFLKVAHQDLCDLYLASKLGCHFLLLVLDDFIYACSYCSQAKKSRIYDFFAHFLMSPFVFFPFFIRVISYVMAENVFCQAPAAEEAPASLQKVL